MPTDLPARVRHALAAVADPDKAPAMQAYMKSAMPFLGVQKAARTAALRPIFAESDLTREQWFADAGDLWDSAKYREERYAALALLRVRRYQPWLRATDEPFLRHLVVTGAWWDLVDEVATKLLAPLRFDIDVRQWAREPVQASGEPPAIWVRRAAIICQVGAGEDTDPGLLADVVDVNSADRRFWITKAIGWALRDYARTDPDWVRQFLDSRQLAPLSVREASKHL